jgi:hypothetical protein
LFHQRIVESIKHLEPLFAPGHEAALGQHLEVLGCIGLAPARLRDDLGHVALALHQDAQDRQPRRIGQHPKAFIGVAAFVGAGLIFAGVTDRCGMALLLARMPWNQAGAPCSPESGGE